MFATLERRLSAIAGGILLTSMMLLVTADVIGRFFFDHPIHGTTEITEFIMVAMLYLTLAHTQAVKAHINVDIFFVFFPERAREVFHLIGCLLGFFLFGLIAWQGTLAALKAWRFWETTFGVIPFPLFYAKVFVPIGSALLCVRYLIDMGRGISILRKGTSRLGTS